MLSRSLFILAHLVGERIFYSTYKKSVKNQWMNYEELKEEQEKLLRNMIKFASKNVAYYHKLFDDLKFSANNVSGVRN